MDKSIQKYLGVISIVLALLLFGCVVWTMTKDSYESYMTEKSKVKTGEANLKQKESEDQLLQMKEKEELNQLKSLKPMYETSAVPTGETKANVYGTMFDEIIKIAKRDGLLIRAIEYENNPMDDPIYSVAPEQYNASVFKFTFVGTYNQLKSFLVHMNNDFTYFISISQLDITSFEENPEYLIMKVAVTLYSKKVKAQSGSGRVFGNKPASGEDVQI